MGLQNSKNWFWVLNCSEEGYNIVIERVVAWVQTDKGWQGLISLPLEGPVLQIPPSVAGGTYKYLDDLTPLEMAALETKKIDPNPHELIKEA
ncbi:hypothetical protein [Microbulbifer epialgicus]|uniref:Immunity protein 35 n=1 Tax=Microbulbifer epialgicus TaxID=393907 RepID=A0ABV4NU76_9GAMM